VRLPSPSLRYGPGPGCPGVRFASVLRTAPVGRALPILAAFRRFSSCPAQHRSTLRPASLHSLRQRGATFPPSFRASTHSLTALAMAPVASFGQPPLPPTHHTRPAQFRSVGFALLRPLRSIRPALPTASIQPLQGTAACRPAQARPTRCIRPRPHDTSAATPYASSPKRPASRWSAHRPTASPPHCHRAAQGQEKGPTPPVATLFIRLRTAKARRPRVKLAFKPRRQKQGPLRGEFHGEYPKPPLPCPGSQSPVICLGFRSLKKAATPS
jgi:hypothetical protein